MQKERSRIMNLYKRVKMGSCIKLVNATTHVLLFENEIVHYSSVPHTTAVIGQNDPNSALQLYGKETYSYAYS